jgi:PAS domain S-box-containing protein
MKEDWQQDELLRLNRSLRLLSLCNQVLFRAGIEAELLADICRLIVDVGGYLMVWVGLAQQDENKSILPVASYGLVDGYLSRLNLTWADSEQGRESTGTAIRTGLTQINQNFQTNPDLVPWRERALALGYHSSIALPLIDKNKIIGALTIYAREPDAFIPEEARLLEELAADLAFGIQTQRIRLHAAITDDQLLKSQEQYRRIVEMGNEGIWSLDAARKTDFVNPALCEKLGYRPEEMIGRPVEEFVFEEDREKLLEEMQRRHAGASYKHEQRFRSKDGSELWFLVYGTPLKDEQGQFQGAFAMLADISERKNAESKLASTTRLLESIIENDPDMIFLKRASDLRFEYFNRAAEEVTGIRREQILGHTAHELFPKEQADFFSATDRAAMQSTDVLYIPEYTISTPRGTRILRSRKIVLRDEQGRPAHVLGIAEDMTELKQTESRLFEEEARYRAAIETSADGFLVVDMQGRLVEVNHAYAQMSGYSREELLGMHLSDLDPEYSVEAVAIRISAIKKAGHARFESVHRKKDGSLYPVQIVAAYSLIQGGQLFVFVTDLTDRKAGEETLKLQAEILEQMNEGIHIVSATDYTIIYTTPVFDRMFGYQRNELIGKYVSILNAPTDRSSPDQTAENINKALTATGYWQGEINNMRKDGSKLTCWVKISSLYHHKYGKVWVAIHEDITERKRIENELLEARQSVYRDVLIREVHHRIKNNLQGVIGVLRLHAMADHRLTEPINEAIGQIQSIALLHGLQGRTGAEKVGLCELTYAIVRNAESTLRKNILFDLPENWKVSAIIESESVPIALILNELVTNAIKHGTSQDDIKIRMRHEPDEHSVTISIYNNGTLPQGFGLDQPANLGTGLQLVASLMPNAGAKLYWEQEGGNVATIFKLSKPTVQLGSYNFSIEDRSSGQ